jgi:hypothetical protein
VWRAPLVAAAGLTGQVLATQAGLPRAALVGMVVAALVAWRLRFRPSKQVTAWRAAAPANGAPPACWIGWLATATWSSTTWPCQGRPPTSITW